LGAKLIKTETELILKSRFVIPEKLEQAGFKWNYPIIEQALEAC
jgi:NAD dependent epimerase/dehydratase family enzyme